MNNKFSLFLSLTLAKSDSLGTIVTALVLMGLFGEDSHSCQNESYFGTQFIILGCCFVVLRLVSRVGY